MGFGRGGWLNWRRGTDYYDEGDLMWLEVATIIHRETHGAKSIDDFCQLFHGGPNNGPELKTYTFEQLVDALNAIAPLRLDEPISTLGSIRLRRMRRWEGSRMAGGR